MWNFFAFMARMKHILRWGLMRNQWPENVAEHSQQCAMLAHCLATMGRKRYGRAVDREKVLAYAVFHEASEVITGDLATPVKYFSADITRAYKNLEGIATERLLTMLPGEMRPEYEAILRPEMDSIEWQYVKAADKLCAYIKCLEEEKTGNAEFGYAKKRIEEDLSNTPLPEVADFLRDYAPGYSLTLDELNAPEKSGDAR